MWAKQKAANDMTLLQPTDRFALIKAERINSQCVPNVLDLQKVSHKDCTGSSLLNKFTAIILF
jgi:hypothetical protein